MHSRSVLPLVCVLTLSACQNQVSVLRTSSQSATGPVIALGNQPLGEVTEALVTYKAVDGLDIVDVGAAGLSAVSGTGESRTQVLRFPSAAAMRAFLATALQDPRIESAGANSLVRALGEPNDTLFPDLWGHRQIKAPAAWDVVTGDPGVIVAVIDTGVDYTHPDLIGDTVIRGSDLVNDDDDPMDDHGHGTHVSGTIAAVANNHLGIAGVAAGVRILAIKALDSRGVGSVGAIANAILQAQKQGAKVITLAFGSTERNAEVAAAIAKVTEAGVLVVAAAGNENNTAPVYPAFYDHAYAVGATDPTDHRAWFSNFGPRINIAAPGVAIHSSVLHGSYEPWNGTSMAVPYVAGAAALLWSYNSTLTPATVRQILEETGDPTFGWSNAAVRRVNLALAIAKTPPGPSPSPTPTPKPQAPGIKSFRLTNPAPGRLAMNWETERPADGRLKHGSDEHLDHDSRDPAEGVTRHAAVIDNVPADTPYYVQAVSRNAVGESHTTTLRVLLKGWAVPSPEALPPKTDPMPAPVATVAPPAPTPIAPPPPAPVDTGDGGSAPAPATTVTLTAAQLAVTPGNTVTTTVTVNYPDGTSDHDVTWSPASPFSRGSYTYNPVTGLLSVTLTAAGDGTVSALTFTATANRAIQATANLNVTLQKNVKVRIY